MSEVQVLRGRDGMDRVARMLRDLPLEQAAEAHRAMETSDFCDKVVLYN